MKWLLLLLVICLCKANAQNNAIFNGGNADGSSVNCFSDILLNNSIFNGGNADGFSTNCYSDVVFNNSIFNGGNADGFSVNCYADVVLNNSIFNGGNADGFSVNCYSDVILNNSIFNGGNADGFSVNCYADVVLNNSIFSGGNADGFSVNCYSDIVLTNAIFNGGNADGFSVNCYLDEVLSNAIFNGGNADGATVMCGESDGTTSPLPIQLISFTGECLNNSVLLKWSTATEINNDYFTIEQSSDANNWKEKSIIAGAGNSTTLLHYLFTDTETSNDISYYRLKQTDYKGGFEYAPLISIENCNNNSSEVNVYPNPSNGIINISYNGDDELYSIEIFNAMGQKINIGNGYQSSINLSDYSDGIYFIHITVGSKVITKKVILKR